MKIVRQQKLWQLTTFPLFFPINAYLIPEDDRLTLIDTGIGRSGKGIVEEIKKTGANLTHIILTHGHSDHVGGLKEILLAFPDAEVAISKREVKLFKQKDLFAFEAQQPVRGSFPKMGLPVRPDRLLKDGDMIGSLIVIETPGHTPGSISLYDERNGHLFVGDLLQTRGGLTICGVPNWRFPFPKMGSWDLETSIASVQKILSYQPTLLATGHGRLLDNPETALLDALDQARSMQKNR
ncbi:MBL fold metallo-hydrolase [Listeria costaricensis]|uniref:MBL fold metallo-hydrolase n=1 Tax=Listeria costaricensis TaxID=2026604 RepID=UPI000C08CC78|nr:MBL fold metallo-hydrolase [Listeria costaricensis]